MQYKVFRVDENTLDVIMQQITDEGWRITKIDNITPPVDPMMVPGMEPVQKYIIFVEREVQ